jgi:23S rRNA pseudouridine1911/1915/1917 synthase
LNQSNLKRLEIDAEWENKRLDAYLHSMHPESSRSDLQKWIADGNVKLVEVKGKPMAAKALKKNTKLHSSMVLEIGELPQKPPAHLEPEPVPLDIVYEDEHIVVLYKPRNMVVHPGNGIHGGTLAAGLLYHYQKLSEVNGNLRPGIVHRLDKDTTGLMVAARTDQAHLNLAQQLEAREISRIYQAICWGHPEDLHGEVEAPIGRDPRNRIKMKIHSQGRFARTHFRVVKSWGYATLLELKLDTGRTHQIRVHMHSLKNSIMGDPLYGGRSGALQRVEPLYQDSARVALNLCEAQMLQAVRLSFRHPVSGEMMEFSRPLNEEFERLMEHLDRTAAVKEDTFRSVQ